MTKANINNDELMQKIRTVQADIRVNQISISVGEVLNTYLAGVIELRPEYQRSLVWNNQHKDMLIESLVLSLPIPSMFIATTPSGKWEVVDGLQRLSTIIDFTVGLSDNDKRIFGDDYNHHSRIGAGLKYLPELAGKSYEEWPEALKLDLKRKRLDLCMMDSLTTEDKKIDLFRRVNQCGLKEVSR